MEERGLKKNIFHVVLNWFIYFIDKYKVEISTYISAARVEILWGIYNPPNKTIYLNIGLYLNQ